MINIEKNNDPQDKKEDVLISKKELLGLTHISYGQLYRWKRMNIIPEDWFIKKSSPTGQETYFKKDKILERINTILSMKDSASLDEIADLFNKKEEHQNILMSDIVLKGCISPKTEEVFNTVCEGRSMLGRNEIILLAIIEKYLLSSAITMDEMKLIVSIIGEATNQLYNKEGKLAIYRKIGVSFVLAYENDEEIIVDKDAVKIIEINLVRAYSQMSKKMMK